MEQSLYETVSEVESDVYYETGVSSGQTGKVDSQPKVTKAVEQMEVYSPGELEDTVGKTEISVKDTLVHDTTSDSMNVQSEIKANVENETVQVTSQKASEKINADEIVFPETETAHINNNDSNDKAKEVDIALTRLSPEMIESDSKLSSSKFSRFNRKRRNSSGSESDGSGLSDVSSWSASRRSPTDVDNKPHDNSKSDVSSVPLPEGSSYEKLSDSLSDSSSSSSSSDESLVSSVSSLDLPNERKGKDSIKDKVLVIV